MAKAFRAFPPQVVLPYGQEIEITEATVKALQRTPAVLVRGNSTASLDAELFIFAGKLDSGVGDLLSDEIGHPVSNVDTIFINYEFMNDCTSELFRALVVYYYNDKFYAKVVEP